MHHNVTATYTHVDRSYQLCGLWCEYSLQHSTLDAFNLLEKYCISQTSFHSACIAECRGCKNALM